MLLTDILGGQVRECQGHSDCEHTVSYDSREIQVNSFHDQTIVEPHTTAHTLCKDSEGNCEAWIDGMIAGVMWHPERMLEPFLPQQIQQVMKL
jgi:gamma-glutamyl-gamma-aminobutyrate hydrolase PuuD